MTAPDSQPEQQRSPFGGTRVPAEYQGFILAASQRWGIPPALLAAQINAESSFNPRAVSPAGALGIAQFMPGTAKAMGVDPWDPESAIHGMARYDAENLAKFGSVELMLAAYNIGPAAVKKGGEVPGGAQNYVKKIMAAVGSDLGIVGAALGNSGSGTDPLKTVTEAFQRFQDPAYWRRNGVLILGVVSGLAGAYFMLEKQGFNVVKKVEGVL